MKGEPDGKRRRRAGEELCRFRVKRGNSVRPAAEAIERVGLLCAPGLEGLLPELRRGLVRIYPSLVLREDPPRQVAEAAWDGWLGAAAVRQLLEELAPAAGEMKLWVVDCRLADGVYPSLAGAAGDRAAVVSTVWSGEVEGLLSTAAHEVGHLLGLEHCDKACLMHQVTTPQAARQRPLDLCEECRERLSDKS